MEADEEEKRIQMADSEKRLSDQSWTGAASKEISQPQARNSWWQRGTLFPSASTESNASNKSVEHTEGRGGLRPSLLPPLEELINTA